MGTRGRNCKIDKKLQDLSKEPQIRGLGPVLTLGHETDIAICLITLIRPGSRRTTETGGERPSWFKPR
jgi:hypothetical protein